MSDVPWGVLLSGGLDSSLVASICARNVARRSSSFPKLHSFTVGLEGSPDLKAAKEVAEFLGTIHHAYTYTLEEGADAIREVIRSVETYDVTTIRASTPMYLMSRKIKAMGIKMVLSGEGADEVFGGYLYFHKAPNVQEFYDETVDKISRLHMYDCLRCNKSMSAWGVEPRCPFLDADFLQVAMNLDPKEKMIVKGPGVSKKEGADEVFGGYLYFHKAPNVQEFYDETVDKISRLHMYDCLRCNKSMSAWGVEPRCPFLDADFLQVAMNLDPKEKMIVKGPGVSKKDTRIEKYVIRKAFDTPDDPYLPDNILWRQKEQFSDGELLIVLNFTVHSIIGSRASFFYKLFCLKVLDMDGLIV